MSFSSNIPTQSIVCLCFSLINIVFTSIIFSAFILFKSRLSKQDSLICQKYFVQFLFFCANICTPLFSSQPFSLSPNATIQIIIFSVYMIFLYMITFSINYDNYLSLRDPTHIFRVLIMKSNNYLLVDICIFIVACTYIGLLFILNFKNVNPYNQGINTFFIIHTDIWLGILLTVISLLSLLFYPLNIANFPNYKFASKANFHFSNRFNFVINICYSLLALCFLIGNILVTYKILYNSELIFQIIYISIFVLGFIDSFLQIGVVYHSSFYFYNLGSSKLGIFFCCFGCNKFYSPPIFYKEDISYRTNDKNLFMMNLYNNIGFTIDDYIIEAFDHNLNVTSLSLAKIYDDLIDGNFVFIKNNTRNDFKELGLENMEYMSNKIHDVEVRIECMFANQIKEVMNVFHITKDQIITSLLSHKFSSLLSKNSKENYFKNLNNLVIKTYDKRLLLEIHNEFSLDQKKKNIIEMYFDHITGSQKNTFVPILVGAFKIKINSFKEIVMFVSINPLIEDIPLEHFNFWQLNRFEYPKTFTKLTTSKDRDSFVITTELVFEKNPKFVIDDFEMVNSTLKSDLIFFKRIKNTKFSMLVLYYEYELDKEKEFDDKSLLITVPSSVIDNKNKNKLSKSNIDSESTSYNITNTDSINGEGNFLFSVNDVKNNEPSFSNEVSITNNNKESNFEDVSIIGYKNDASKSVINKNGFDSMYNGFKGIVYFSFENLFEFGGCWSSSHFYSNYLKELLKHFHPSSI